MDSPSNVPDRHGSNGVVRRATVAGLTSVTGLAVRVTRGHPRDRAKVAGMAWWYRAAEAGERYRHQVYKAMYFLGLTPWNRETPHPFLAKAMADTPKPRPDAPALEIGCGTGTNAVFLAQQGWTVTAVDMVSRALELGRAKATAAGVEVNFMRSDATRLDSADGIAAPGGYDLIVDIGCFHAIPLAERNGYVDSITALAAPAATLLLIGQFARPARDSRKAGLTPTEVENRFTGWEITHREMLSTAPESDLPADHISEWFEIWHYRLRRKHDLDCH
ncbi:MAG TPA: methyltransferase domain-containing protein [Micromonosporaceae bacterium]|jgi:SAM-dependent methyltransferase